MADEIKLTLQQLISNPTGKNTAYTASRAMIKESLVNKYNTMMYFSKNKLKYKIYKVNDDYIFHYKIPSETFRDDLEYDVIIQFYPDPDKPDCVEDRNTNRYFLKIFSNSPNFTFTYTYVVYKNGMLASGMDKFCNKEALQSAPVVRNPVETYGYEKTVYFACLHIINNKLYEKHTIDRTLFKMRKDTFDNTVASQNYKLAEYNKLKTRSANIKKKIKKQKSMIASLYASKLPVKQIEQQIRNLVPKPSKTSKGKSNKVQRINRKRKR